MRLTRNWTTGEIDMRRVLQAVLALVFAVALTGCASGPKIQTDHDPSVDFSKYHTYNFFKPLGIEGHSYSSILGQNFRDAISREMDSRGYEMSDDPDLLLNVSARLQEKTKVTTYNDPYPYYGYRMGYYDPWYGYGYGTQTHVSQYTEGTVNIDMVDAAQKRMVWEGIAIGRVHEDRTNLEVKEAIFSGVAQMFSQYPFRGDQ